ncbi:winged helix-turn-helix domain-containing protein [Streptomyces roseirectus]|uniref:Winged helix-turn-helix domain-containing protein n=1 Tax=Streptomyces roseirectus TaxID=2768066 RepID=A0A7H0IQP1_9ACTN|nr:BTAD domain-containing putative transcriptional regulator [Streptomyces roseirectus]QNP75107.1 winged helix-turn-helix domain-containing protein [Streptomyces roseirectus]
MSISTTADAPRQEYFGATLRRHRLEAGLTQQRLAEQSGVSVREIRYLERSQVLRPSAEIRRRLDSALSDGGPVCDVEAPCEDGTPLIGVLGPLVVWRGGESVRLDAMKQRLLLALLALRPNEAVGRDEIVDVLWPDEAPASCVNLVHTYVARLRRALRSERGAGAARNWIDRCGGGYALRADADELDVLRFTMLLDRADALDDPGLRADTLAAALGCWRGPVAADLDAGPTVFTEWTELPARRIEAALAYADLAMSSGGQQRAAVALRKVARDEPWHEALHARLMLALAASGQRTASLDVFQDMRKRLRNDLGLEPGAELKAAQSAVLREDEFL